MGYMVAMSPCLLCKRVFSYNPDRVPSSAAVTGKREPVCADCMAMLNEKRKARGLEPFPILEGAYEGAEEGSIH